MSNPIFITFENSGLLQPNVPHAKDIFIDARSIKAVWAESQGGSSIYLGDKGICTVKEDPIDVLASVQRAISREERS